MSSESEQHTLTSNSDYRLKVEYTHSRYGAQVVLQWRAHGAATFVVVEAEHLSHTAFCAEGGCLNGGCCVGDGVCQCPAGYGGSRCELVLAECADGPSGTPQAGGLTAQYYKDQAYGELGAQQVDATIAFSWSAAPATGVPTDYFSVRWAGLLYPPHSGWYRLFASATHGSVRVMLNSQAVIPYTGDWNTWVYLPGERLAAVMVDYVHSRYSASVTLEWEGPGFYRHTIPKENLLHYPSGGWACPCPDECSEHGNCLPSGTCVCDGIYSGANCEAFRCQIDECRLQNETCHDASAGSSHNECNGAGVCTNGICECEPGVTSESSCVLSGCPGNAQCSAQGSCSAAKGVCECNAGHFGQDCQFDVCEAALSLQPGLAVEYYSDLTGDQGQFLQDDKAFFRVP